MSRPRGSIIGAKPTWTTTATSGIWTLRQAEEMKADGKWPRGPEAPTGLAGTPGDGQVALTWTAPATTHGTITDYIVEYTPAAGSPTLVATGSTAASYTLTGLTNGTSYTVRVAAVNHTRGDFSDSVAVTPSAGAVAYLSGTSGGISGTGNNSSDKFQSISNSNQLTVTIQAAGSYRIQLEGNGRRIFKNGIALDWSEGGIVYQEDGFYVFQAVSVSAGTTVGVDAGQRFHIWKE